MKTCPQCGFHHTDLDERCIRCGTYLDALNESDPLTPAGRETFDFELGKGPRWRLEWPARLVAAVRRRLFIWREALRSPLPMEIGERSMWTAGFLAILPGLGQIYNHQPKKAGLIFLFVGAILALAILTLYHPLSNYILLGYLLAVLYSFHDGVVTAKRINRDYLTWQHRTAFYFAWIFYVALFCFLFQWAMAYGVLQFRYISADPMAPFLSRGERVTVDLLSYALHRPRVGDVVLYDPPPLVMELVGGVSSEWTSVNPTSMIERIVAGPGQTFERRGGVFYRDGQPVGPGEQPIVQSEVTWDFKITAPKDSYVILFSYTFGKDWLTGAQAPSLNSGAIKLKWEKTCLIPREDITGRVWFVYQPPQGRRFIR